MPVQSARSNRQTSIALQALRDMVLSGRVQAGQRLYEVALSKEIGISRTPIRAAMATLEQEGLLERLGAGGYAVRRFSFDDVIDAIELRGVLEGTAARLAAERGADAAALEHMGSVVSDLDEVVAAGAEALDFDAYGELNGVFHASLARLAGSATIAAEVERAARLPFASPSAFLRAQSGILEIRRSLIFAQEQHRDLLQAIAQREGTRAEAIAREHARLARKNLEYVMDHDQSLMRVVPGLSLVTTEQNTN